MKKEEKEEEGRKKEEKEKGRRKERQRAENEGGSLSAQAHSLASGSWLP
jgi:hypothetical protein